MLGNLSRALWDRQIVNFKKQAICTDIYDAENRLVKASPRVLITGSRIYEYEYDYMGRRVKKTEKRHTMPVFTWTMRSFEYDGWNLLRERVEFDGAVSTNQYVWGLDISGNLGRGAGVGGLLVMWRSDSAGTSNYYYCTDGNCNITDMVEGSENVIAHYEYSPLGETLVVSGLIPATNSWRFSTRYYDTETGLIMYPRRPYSPILGRFLSNDPIWETGGENLYGYADNNSINRVDPFGLSCWNPFSWFGSLAENDCTRAGGSGTADKCCCKDNIFNPKDKCCENNQIVDKVKVYVINRSGGQRTGMTGGHIDLVVPGIGLVGFFGDVDNPDDGSGRGIGWNIPGNLNIGQEWLNGITPRPWYTLPPEMFFNIGDDAQGNPILRGNILSTICELKVCPANARQMATRANQIDNDPGRFHIAGRNCSTMGCSILGAGGVMSGGISGIDNPQNLMDQLRDSGANCFTGYIFWNWQRDSSGQWIFNPNDIRVQEAGQAPVVPTGSSR